MKEILKNLGLLIILVGVIFLGIVVFAEQQTNAKLVASIILIIGGFLAHILIHKFANLE